MSNQQGQPPPFVGADGEPIGAALGLTGSDIPEVDEELESRVLAWRELEEKATALGEESLRNPTNQELRLAFIEARNQADKYGPRISERVVELGR